jgi:hypothetical protein
MPNLAALVLLAAAGRAEAPRLAVLDLADKGAGAALSASLTDVVTASLGDLRAFVVLSRADIQQMLAFEEQKQLAGCDASACLAEIGGALGVALLVSGSVGKVGSTLLLSLTLTDTASAKVIAREQRDLDPNADWRQTVAAATRYLVRDLLERSLGDLIISTSESGADVAIDDRLIGVTPLARQRLASGPHKVRITKSGFVSFARDIDVERDTPQVLDVTLVPSMELIDAYDSRAGTFRTAAWLSGGAGALLLGAGLAARAWNGERIDAYRADLEADGCGPDGTPRIDGCAAAYAERRDGLVRTEYFSQAGIWVGGAGLVAALALFALGPTPGIYDRYKVEVGDGGAAFSIVGELP